MANAGRLTGRYKKWWVPVAVGGLACLSVTPFTSARAVAAPSSASGQPVRVGWINIQGSTGTNLPDITDGAQVGVKYSNAQLGGIGGRPVTLITCFTDESSAGNIACANKLVQSGVVAILVGQESDPGDIAKIAVGAGIPYAVMTGNSAQELTLKGAFSFTAGNGGGIAALAAYAKKSGYKNVAALTVDVPAGIAVVKTLGGAAFKKVGVGLQVIPVPQSVTDMTPQVQAAVSAGADALLVVGATTFCTAFYQAVASIAPNLPRMSSPACDTPNVIATSPHSAITGTAIPLPFRLDSNAPSVVAYRNAVKRYSNNPGLAKDAEAATGYATVVALANILKANLVGKNVTAAAVLAALPKANAVPLPLAPGVTMTCNAKVIPIFASVCSAGFFVYKLTNGGSKAKYVTSINAAPLFAS